MSEVIWKFPLAMEEHQDVMMPKGAKILTVQIQGVIPCIWAIVNPANEPEKRHIQLIGTGHIHPEIKGTHLGTVQHEDLGYVWHFFEVSR